MMALGVERSSPSRDSRSTKRCVRDTRSDATAVVARTGIINLDGVVACFGMIDILSQSGYGCSQLAPGTLRVGYVQLDPTEDAIEDKCRNCTFFVPLVVLNRSRSLTIQHLNLCGSRLLVGHCASVQTAVRPLGLDNGQSDAEPLLREARA
uniref:(northern house mosquito) hypothetical protein n=1 Tax=Culex pipiens TaxID=7175 RepID=A0A8D8AKZ5_CULPI